MPHHHLPFMRRLPHLLKLLFLLAVSVLFVRAATLAHAAPALTIESITWDAIGLKHNLKTGEVAGPNKYPVGVRVCNEGTSTATNVETNFVWDSANQYISLEGATSLSTDELQPGECKDFYYTAVVDYDPNAIGTAREYHITATSDELAASVSTPTPRELYVEGLQAQARNDVLSIDGPSQMYLGGTYQFTLDSKTATQGYEQLTTFLTFPNTIFDIVKVDTTYTAPAGATNDKVYADACGWDTNPLSPTYMTCVGPENYPGGKAGGDIHTVYTVRIIGEGSGTMTNLIYDKSGASWHYNADYGAAPDNVFNFTTHSPLEARKSDTLVLDSDGNGTASPGDTLEYTIQLENIGDQPITGVTFTDAPDANTTLQAGSVTTSRGTVTSGNTDGDSTVAVNVGDIPAGQIVTITFRVIINDPLPDGTTQVANQGITTADYLNDTVTDDPSTAELDDPTITEVTIPTAIQLASFTAVQEGEHVQVHWLTTVEDNTWGYHIYRSTSPDRATAERITDQPILAGGDGSGGMYDWTDYAADPGATYYYWLQEVEVNGDRHDYGPADVTVRSDNHYHLFMPFVRD